MKDESNSSDFIDKIIKFYSLNKRISELVKIKIELITSIEQKPKSIFISAIIAKVIRTHDAIILLCKNGFGEDALILSRSLFEIMITVLYIFRDKTDKTVMRYLSHSTILKEKNIEAVLKYNYQTKNNDRLTEKEISRIKEESEIFKNKYNYDKSSWSDKSIRKMAISLDKEILYDIVYAIQCSFSHSDAESINSYVNKKGDTLEFNIDGSPKNLSIALLMSLEFFIEIIDVWSKEIELDLESEIEKIKKEIL